MQEIEERNIQWERIVYPLAILAAAWLYARMFVLDDFSALGGYLLSIAAILVLVTELAYRKLPHIWESWIWLACFAANCLSLVLGRNRVWENGTPFFFLHVFFVWWVLSRSGKLTEGKSGHYLPLDALHGFITVPFSKFVLIIRHLAEGIRSLFKKRRERSVPGWTIVVVIICLGLFVAALKLLLDADMQFAQTARKILDQLALNLDYSLLITAMLCLPVGCWLYGLIMGMERLPRERLMRQKNDCEKLVSSLAKVPGWIWTAMIALFSMLYLAFFLLQGSYLFGAFRRTLPESFTVSMYARQGFFELCKVMAVNFVLLWMATRMVNPESKNRLFLMACGALLAESMIFAVIAFSKIALYISCFGFTPLRLQSTWLVCVLFAGAALWLWNLITGKAVFRKWMIFGAVTLSVLSLL